MHKIKICGIRRLEDIEIINKYLPDYVGFVFADSKRKVTHELAQKLKDNLNSDIISVGVFVDANPDEILALFNDNIIEIAQLHGSENENYILNLKEKTNDKLKIIKAIEMSNKCDLSDYDNSKADYLLLDSGKGSGKTFDWNLIQKNFKKDYFLAGGLNISNIYDAINQFKPYAIDLSSGVEVEGFKDEDKIRQIMGVIR